MIDAAVADLAADTHDKGRPDHRDVTVDIDDRIRYALRERAIGSDAVGELGPALLPKGRRTVSARA